MKMYNNLDYFWENQLLDLGWFLHTSICLIDFVIGSKMTKTNYMTSKSMPNGPRSCLHSISMLTFAQGRLRVRLQPNNGVGNTSRPSKGIRKHLILFFCMSLPFCFCSIHQTHYEQYGDVSGTVTIDGRPYSIETNSVRDHSIAHMRDWRNFHRYIIHFFNLANGDRITVGIVSIPLTFSR